MVAVNEVFQSAPMGRRVIAPLVFIFAATLGGFAIGITQLFRAPVGPVTANATISFCLAPLVPLMLLVFAFARERSKVSSVRIEENCLVTGSKRHQLAGLVRAERDPDILKGARRTWGNGGLGAIRGRFRSKRVGKFEAFLTDTDHAVVLRWPEKIVAVSPQDPEFFILSARKVAGLR